MPQILTRNCVQCGHKANMSDDCKRFACPSCSLIQPVDVRVIQYESTGEPIRVGKLTDQQSAIIDSTPFHLEAFPGDDDRLRVVCDDGSGNIGPWFSRRWNPIGFKRFWPC